MVRRICFLSLLSILFMSCHSKKTEENTKAVFTATTPMVTNISLPQSYVANIQSLRNIEVRSQQEGILQQIYVDEGQMVRAGQPLFRIAIVGEDEEIAKAKSAQEQAEIDLQNTSRLTENNIVSPNARRMAKAKYQSATADYKLAVLHKRLSIIRAPFSGVLGRIPQKVGSFIQQDDLLTTLSDNSKMQVYFNISESDYLDLQQHPQLYMQLPLKLLLANGSTFPARGSIKDISGQFDNATGTISVRSLFANPKGILRNGQSGTVQLLVQKKNAIVIPQEAVYELQDRKYVFVVDKNNVAHQRQIQISAELTGVYVISSGLTASDHYLIDGIQKVNDGDHVHTRFVTPRQSIKSNEIAIQ